MFVFQMVTLSTREKPRYAKRQEQEVSKVSLHSWSKSDYFIGFCTQGTSVEETLVLRFNNEFNKDVCIGFHDCVSY